MSELYAPSIIRRIRQELDQVFLFGHAQFIESLLIAYFARGHVLIEGPPGTAKTLTAKMLARLLAKSFNRIQFTTDLLPGDILGAHIFSPSKGEFVFMRGPIFSELIVADEINRTPPRTQSALLEAMEERQVTIEGRHYALSPDFFVVATQNPQDYEGTFALPEVQMDRFIFKLVVDHAGPDVEVPMLQRILEGTLPPPMESIKATEIDRARVDAEIKTVKIDESLLRYISQVLEATRKHPMCATGSSVRGGIALARTARIYALMQGRDYVTPDDIKQLTLPTLRHRIRLNPEAQVSNVSEEGVLVDILGQVAFPK